MHFYVVYGVSGVYGVLGFELDTSMVMRGPQFLKAGGHPETLESRRMSVLLRSQACN